MLGQAAFSLKALSVRRIRPTERSPLGNGKSKTPNFQTDTEFLREFRLR